MKKILCMIITAALIASLAAAPVFAATDSKTPVEDKAGLMCTLGIISTEEMKGTVTRGEYMAMLMKTAAEQMPEEDNTQIFEDVKPFDENAVFILQAYRLGYIKGFGDGTFAPNDIITLEDALNVLYAALGYTKDYLKKLTPTEEFNQLLNLRKELLKGVNPAEKLDRQNAVCILYNALFTDILQIGGIENGDIKYGRNKGENLLKLKHSVKPAEGVVRKDMFTALDEAKGAGDGRMELFDGEKYETFTVLPGQTENLIGRKIRCYIKETDDGYSDIIYIDSAKPYNDEFKTDARNIRNFNKNNLEFTYEENEKIKTIQLKQSVAVIYNGKYTEFFSETDFVPAEGSVCFVDSGKDGDYETVIIEAIKYITVGRVNTIDKRIIDKYDSNLRIDYGSALDAGNFYIYLNGAEINPEELKQMDILEIKTGKDGNFITAEVSQNTVRGTIDSIADSYITIDGTRYDVTNYFTQNPEFGKDLKPSSNGLFYLSTGGKAVAFQEITLSTEGFGFLIEASAPQGLGGVCEIKLLAESGNTFVIQLADKVKFNGGQLRCQEVCESGFIYDNEKNESISQVIYYKQNAAGEICAIETAGSDENGKLYKSGEKNSRIYVGYNDTPRVFGEQFLITPETISFFVPLSGEKVDTSSENFRTVNTNYFIHDGSYITEFFNVSDAGTADIMVVYRQSEGASIPVRSPAVVVNKIQNVIDEDGGITYMITGYSSGSKVTYMPTKPEVFENISEGDIIQVVCDVNEKVENTNLLYRCKDLIGKTDEELESMLF